MAKTKIDYGKLPVVFKRKWLKALRSGEYLQGIGQLINKKEKLTSYCCLGVAACIGGVSNRTKQRYISNDTGYIPNNKLVPKILQGESSLTELLAQMNDSMNNQKKQSFKQIANWIDKNL